MSTYTLRNIQDKPEINFEECARDLSKAEHKLHRKASTKSDPFANVCMVRGNCPHGITWAGSENASDVITPLTSSRL